MNKYFNRFLILAAGALTLASCDENSWNDELPGYEVPDKNAATQTISYTMTPTDFAYIGKYYKDLYDAAVKKGEGDKFHIIEPGDYQAFQAAFAANTFNNVITAEKYLPLFLRQPSFPYFALNNGSAVKVTYLTTGEQPKQVIGATNAETYTVTTADYQAAWGSEEDYTEAFAPSQTASRNIPKILRSQYPDAAEGRYVIVNYNQSATDPVFQSSEEPAFQPSSVLGSLTKGNPIEIKGVVMAVSTQGPIVQDAAGSVFVYSPSNNADLKIGDQVDISSTVDSYNYGFQIKRGAEAAVTGNQTVSYPTPKSWTGTEIDQFVANAMAADATPITPVYTTFTGTVAVSGNYINISLDGTTVQLSPYGAGATVKAMLTDGATVTLEGYVMAIASKGKFLNTIITKVGSTPVQTISSVDAAAISRAVTVASTAETAIYTYTDGEWTVPADMVILTPADYAAMGRKSDLSGSQPETYLPVYCRQKFPYAVADDVKYIVYAYYNGTETITRCAECRFDGSEWVGGWNGATLTTSQFIKQDGKWEYSPNVTITLPYGKNQTFSATYYQACVDYVLNHVPDGAKYVTSYGNNDYYTGASAYQNNVDLRPDKAIAQYPEGYAGMTDAEIVALMKERFEKEVFPAVLAELHPDAAPTASGLKPEYTINFYYYTGTTQPATIIYKVTAPATFTYQSCTWNN